ncbi:MAG: DNA polymerase III subunit gamma/tau [Bacteroidaceae bacterium]|nr:DNA polymerase III subunit gamma/tau [Bacteroidaceae bacterium]
MQEYIVSARKYRPMTFSTVVGQSALTTTLKNAIASDKLAHAYLFCGPRGVGKTTCARIFAKTINCLSPMEDGESCGQCESCVAFDKGRSMNIHELDAASNNSVEDIRELIKQVQIPPQTGRYKVFIIDEVHMLSSQAFNAFLKTLEEPPSYVIFILATTEKHKILPTILSRCQVYDFSRMSVENTVAHLRNVAEKEGYTTEDDALQLIAEKADGGMRDALSIFDQMVSFTAGELTYDKVCASLNVLSTEYYFRLTDHFLAQEVAPCMLLFNEVLCKGFDGSNFIAGLANHMRQLLVAKDASTLPLLEVSEKTRQRYCEQAAKCSSKFIYRAIKLCNDCDQAYRLSHNKRLQVEICLIQCAQLSDADDAAGSGRCPGKILKPIFNLGALAQPSPQTAVPQPEKAKTGTHAPQHAAHTLNIPTTQPSGQMGGGGPRLKKFNLNQLGPSINVAPPTRTTEEKNLETETLEAANKPYTQEDITFQWHSYVERMPLERRAMAMRMRAMTPKLISSNTFEIVANNPQIAQYLLNLKDNILQTMRKNLCNLDINMSVRIADIQEVRHITSKPALYQMMVQRNKNVQRLAEMLKLEICM